MKNFFFDYIYYRVNQFYFKWDGRNGITSVIAVSLIQCLSIANLFLIPERLLYTRQQISSDGNSKKIAYAAACVLLLLIAYNYYKYENKFNYFKRIWKDEPLKMRRIKGWLVLFCLVFPFIPLIILGFIK